MPVAKGLFHKSIIQSGAAVKVGTLDAALATRDKLLAQLEIKDYIVEKLQAVPLQDLIKAFAKAGLLAYMPAVDGKTLPTNPFDPAIGRASCRDRVCQYV